VTLNGDGSFTFDLLDSVDHADGAGENAMDLGFTITGTPNADVLAAAVDGDGDPVSGLSDASVTQSFTVSVVDDVPVATANDLTGEPEVVTVTITAENYSETGAGFTVTGRQIDSNGTLTDKSTDLVSTNQNPPGFGVTGAASGANSEIGYSDSDMVSEELHIDFDQPISEVTISYSWMNSQEDGTYTLYRDGQPVGSATVTGVTDQIDAAFTAQADDGGSFDSIVFTAPSGGGNDFLVHSVEFEQTVDGTGGVVAEVVTVDEDDLSDGSDLTKEPLTASGDLGLNGEELISIDYGADGAADNAPTALQYDDMDWVVTGPAGLTSAGEAITYNDPAGDVLTATAGGRDIFTVTLNSDGSYTFEMLDQIDHETADGQNVEALSFSVTGTPSAAAIADIADYDQDAANGLASQQITQTLAVDVTDDVPVAIATDTVVDADTVSLDEDDLGNGSDGTGPTSASGSLGLAGHALYTIDLGADAAGSTGPTSLNYDDFDYTITGPTDLTSNGQAIVFTQSGDTLTGVAGGNDVMTVTLNADGTYTVALLDQIDHPAGAGENTQNLSFSLSGQCPDQ